MRKPSVVLLAVRVLAITLLATLTTFAVALFLGIAGIALTNLFHGGGVHMANAYRHVALPVAGAALVIAFVVSLSFEIKHYRSARAASGELRVASRPF
jgi:hypothetical protein